MGNVNYQFLLSFLIIGLGYLSKRSGLLQERDGAVLTRIIFNFTLPGVVITTFSTIKVDASFLLLPCISLGFGLIMAIAALFVFGKEKSNNRGMLSMVLPGFNIGLFAYPLVEVLFGNQALKYIASFDMGNALIVFVICYVLANYFARATRTVNYRKILGSLIKSVPLLVYLITLGISLGNLHYPGPVIDLARILAKANAPLALFLLGLYLSFSFDKSGWGKMFKVLAIRYAAGLAVGLLLFIFLPFGWLFRFILLIGLILPIGMAVLPYAVEFVYDEKFVGTLCNISNICSFGLMWVLFLIMGHR